MTDNTTLGAIPIVILEIDRKQCIHTYGSAPCEAGINVTGATECFNTLASCQDTPNYNDTDNDVTDSFVIPHDDIPTDVYLIPSVVSVQTSPTRINIGGRSGRDKPLGLRARCTAGLHDHPHSDLLQDPYLGNRSGPAYNPLERGTFWSKWLKRNPYHNNWPMRIREGYVGQALEDMSVRHYIIEKIEGPGSSGNVTITGTDALRIADDDRGKFPPLSTGRLLAGISDSATTMTVMGATLSQYTELNTNVVRIGDEIITYTGVSENIDGDIEFTGMVRGQFGTDADSHDAEDSVQACKQYIDAMPWEITRDLLLFVDVPSEFIPYADWEDEAGTWLQGLLVSNLLSEPTGITELIGQLSEQCTFYIWWDERKREIRFKAVRPATGTIPLITQDKHLIQNGTSIKVRPELRASEVWVSILPHDYSGDFDKRGNYARTLADIAPSNPYGERRIYEVFSRWLITDAQMQQLAFRLRARYTDPPKYLHFSLDAKDRALDVADIIDVEYDGFGDFTGGKEVVRYQIISAHESPPGERLVCEAQKFDFAIGFKNGFWMVSDAPNYADATEEEKLTGFWWADEDGLINDEQGYVWS